MADAEPIIIHGTPTGITVKRRGLIDLTVVPGANEKPFGQVVVVFQGKEPETFSTEDPKTQWHITIKSAPEPAPPVVD